MSHKYLKINIISAQPVFQISKPLLRLVVLYPDRQSLPGTQHHHQPLSSGNRGVTQITLQEHIMLHEDRDNHDGIFRALCLMYKDRISYHMSIGKIGFKGT